MHVYMEMYGMHNDGVTVGCIILGNVHSHFPSFRGLFYVSKCLGAGLFSIKAHEYGHIDFYIHAMASTNAS